MKSGSSTQSFRLSASNSQSLRFSLVGAKFSNEGRYCYPFCSTFPQFVFTQYSKILSA